MANRAVQLKSTFSGLFGKPAQQPAAAAQQDAAGPGKLGQGFGRKRDQEAVVLPLERIRPDPEQVRRAHKDASDPDVQTLALSIKKQGLLQPLIVRWLPEEDVYQLVSGERHRGACKLAGVTEVAVRLVEVTPAVARARQVHENIHRRNLDPLELAAYVQGEMHKGRSLEDLAEELCHSPSWVSKAKSVADCLSPEAQAAVSQGEKTIPLDTLSVVAQLPAEEQGPTILKIHEEGLTRNAVREHTRAARVKAREQPSHRGRGGRPLGGLHRQSFSVLGGKGTVLVTAGTPEQVKQALQEALAQAGEDLTAAAQGLAA